MRRTKRTVEIRVESRRVVAARKVRVQALAGCPLCSREAKLITPEEAGSRAGVSVRTIYRWVETGRVHFIETGEGLLFICKNSLPV